MQGPSIVPLHGAFREGKRSAKSEGSGEPDKSPGSVKVCKAPPPRTGRAFPSGRAFRRLTGKGAAGRSTETATAPPWRSWCLCPRRMRTRETRDIAHKIGRKSPSASGARHSFAARKGAPPAAKPSAAPAPCSTEIRPRPRCPATCRHHGRSRSALSGKWDWRCPAFLLR